MARRSTRLVLLATLLCLTAVSGTAHAATVTHSTNFATCRHIGAYGKGYAAQTLTAASSLSGQQFSMRWHKQRLISSTWTTVWSGTTHYGARTGGHYTKSNTINFSSADVGKYTRVRAEVILWQLDESGYKSLRQRIWYPSPSCKVW